MNRNPFRKARDAYIKHCGWCPKCHLGRHCNVGVRLYNRMNGARQYSEYRLRLSPVPS